MNIFKKISRIILYLAIALPVTPGYAEDIDIYARPPVTTHDPNLNPNVLIVIDNSTNWASASQHWPGGIKQGEAELNALRIVIGEQSDKTNVGLMMFTTTGNTGGYVRFHIRQMTAANKAAFSELIGFPSGCTNGANSLNGTPNCILKNFQNPNEKVSGSDYSGAMLDVFKYFGGYTWPAKAGADVAGANVNSSQFGTQRYAGPDANADPAAYSADKTSYNSPLGSANSCAKNYVIFIGNGYPGVETVTQSERLGPPSLLPTKGVGGDVTQLPLANLTLTTSTPTVLLATPACGTYAGADMTASTAACQAKATDTGATGFGTLYPGYTSYTCASAATCSAGSTTTTTTLLGNSACGTYATQEACQAASPWGFSGYTSYSCGTGTACTSSSANPTNPIVASTAYISNDLSVAANCTAYGNTNYPSYSGFTCTKVSTLSTSVSCSADNNFSNQSKCDSYAFALGSPWPSAGNTCTAVSTTGCTTKSYSNYSITSLKKWQIDATTKITTGNTYSMNGISQTTVSTNTFSQNINGAYTTTAYAPNGTFSAPAKINYFDEWARFLNQTDVSSALGKQNINTFTIDVFKDAQDNNETALLISAAQAGGGKYFKASDENAITNALRKIFSEIQSVNSVFASSSLPVSVNTQGTYLNQVFMGMFRPEGSASPRWPGNLKQYKFKIFNGVLKLADKNGDEAISTSTGFVTPCANSFWSTDTGQYWNFGGSLALGSCSDLDQLSAFPTAGSASVYSDGPDGEVVEKGGAAQRLRGAYSTCTWDSVTAREVCTGLVSSSTNYATRVMKTCAGSCTTLTNFNTANTSIDATALNLSDTTQRDSLINWVRGQDVDNENANLTSATATPANSPITDEMRPSVHGGVVHAQPAVVDYGGTTGTIAFYGADDGVFHAVDGRQADTNGNELWGFIAPETFSKLNRLRTNSPPIAFPGVGGSPAPTRKDYFFDGATGVYQKLGNVWIYPSMRRGGRSIYAFNVTDPTSPSIKWRKGCFTNDTSDDTVCSTGWAGVGQTWSTPTIAYLNGYVDSSSPPQPKPVLIFGGGYDQCEDANSQTRCATTPRKGANIWFVDANTGDIIRTYPTQYSVPGDLAVLKDANGYLTYVYASDTGGNVYRINVGSTDTLGSTFTSWSSNSAATDIILASLSVSDHARKFINGPTIVPTFGFNAVLIGSGDREHPLVTDYACGNYTATTGSFVTNQFYMLMDKPAAGYPSPTLTPGALVDVTSGTTTIATVSGTTTITNVRGTTTTSSTKGWLFNFGQCEQAVNEALTVGGVTYFGTNAPSSSSGTSCTANLGIARGYAVDYLTGNPIPSSAAVAAAIAAAATATSAGPGTGVGASGEVINGFIAGVNGGSRSAGFVGGGMPPSPVAGVVDIEGTKYPFCIGCIDTGAANSSALAPIKPNINPTGKRFRPFWYIEND